MAGAAHRRVTACRSMSRVASSAMNLRMMTVVAPVLKECMNQPKPAVCRPGKQLRPRSSVRQSIQSTPAARVGDKGEEGALGERQPS
ncbi:hypothetical protein [Streptomyces sp. NPDC046805]|uniref:hypothetical protein n=1 Tax=Streptomyces sp. NPDC046805 TaxID=3155134 RepID=UPI0033FC9DAA